MVYSTRDPSGLAGKLVQLLLIDININITINSGVVVRYHSLILVKIRGFILASVVSKIQTLVDEF